jgi:hypothetical protein
LHQVWTSVSRWEMHRPMVAAADRHLVWRGSLAAERSASPTHRGKFACRHSDMSTAFLSPSVEVVCSASLFPSISSTVTLWRQLGISSGLLGHFLENAWSSKQDFAEVPQQALRRSLHCPAAAPPSFAHQHPHTATHTTLRIPNYQIKGAGASGLRMEILDSKIKGYPGN